MSLKLEKISKRVSNKRVLSDLSLEVSPGEVFGILGANSEYLTGILRIISGSEKADSGNISFAGKPLSECVIGNAIRENLVETKRRFLKSKNSDSTADSIATKVSKLISEMADVFLINQPLQGFDATIARKVQNEIRNTTAQRKTATLVASHYPNEILRTCDRVAIISQGEAVQIGTPAEVYSTPNTIASAIAFGPINLIEAKRLTSNNESIPEFFTVDGEHRISTQQFEKSQLGNINQSVMLAVRPENVSISFGASFPEDNLLKARVKSIDFRGPFTRVSLDSDGLELSALVLRVVGLEVGEECMVGIPPSRIQILTK